MAVEQALETMKSLLFQIKVTMSAYALHEVMKKQCHKVRLLRLYASATSSHQRCSMKKGVLRNFAKFTGKHLCQSLFFNKVAGWGLQFDLKRLWHRCFPKNFAKFIRAPFHRTPQDDCFWSAY